MDVYLAIGFADALFLVDGSNALQSASGIAVLPKWKTNISTAINESLYGDIPISLLPAEVYNLYIAVVPAGETDFSHYYVWSTHFDITSVEVIQREGVLLRSGSFKLNGIDYHGRKDIDTYINVKYSIYDKYVIFDCTSYSYVYTEDASFHDALVWLGKALMSSSLLSGNHAFLESQGIRYQVVDEEADNHSDSMIIYRMFDGDGINDARYIIYFNDSIDPRYTFTLIPGSPDFYYQSSVQF